jgi:hypothetical protein
MRTPLAQFVNDCGYYRPYFTRREDGGRNMVYEPRP